MSHEITQIVMKALEFVNHNSDHFLAHRIHELAILILNGDHHLILELRLLLEKVDVI